MYWVARDCKTNSTFLVFMAFYGFLGGTRGICSNSHFSSILNVYVHGSLFEIQSAWVKVPSTMRPTKFSVTLRPPLLRLVTAETWIIMKEMAFISTTLPHCTRLSHRGNAHFLLCTFSSLKRSADVWMLLLVVFNQGKAWVCRVIELTEVIHNNRWQDGVGESSLKHRGC